MLASFVGASSHTSELGREASGRPLMGIGALIGDEEGNLFVALEIAAFNTWARGGLMPHAKHGASGVWALAVAGSKFEGTGLEKEHIGHIHVPALIGDDSAVGRWNGLSARDSGDAVALLEGVARLVRLRCWIDDRFDGFGTSVILAEDFIKPAC